jgi:competence protein ComEC
MGEGRQQGRRWLREQGVDDIDVMVSSHPDSDHLGGLITVLGMNDIPVRAVVYGGYQGTTTTWDNFGTAVANEGLQMTPAQYPETFLWGDMTVDVLNPEAGLINPDKNNAQPC